MPGEGHCAEFDGALHHALAEKAFQHLGEDGDDINVQGHALSLNGWAEDGRLKVFLAFLSCLAPFFLQPDAVERRWSDRANRLMIGECRLASVEVSRRTGTSKINTRYSPIVNLQLRFCSREVSYSAA